VRVHRPQGQDRDRPRGRQRQGVHRALRPAGPVHGRRGLAPAAARHRPPRRRGAATHRRHGQDQGALGRRCAEGGRSPATMVVAGLLHARPQWLDSSRGDRVSSRKWR